VTTYSVSLVVWSNGGATHTIPNVISIGQQAYQDLTAWGLFPDYSTSPRPTPAPNGSWQDRLGYILLQNMQSTTVPLFFQMGALLQQMATTGNVASTDQVFVDTVTLMTDLQSNRIPAFNDLMAFYTYVAPFMTGGVTATAVAN
jgi:hypothetical protein